MRRGNNRQRAAQASRDRMDAVTYVHVPRGDGRRNVFPMRYLAPDERREFLARATTGLL